MKIRNQKLLLFIVLTAIVSETLWALPAQKAVNKEENVYVLQMLDLLSNLDSYLDYDYDEARKCFQKYIESHNIKRSDVDKYIRKFPLTAFRFYYELRLDNVLA